MKQVFWLLLGGLLLATSAHAERQMMSFGSTTTTNSTIAVTNTFQQALAASSQRIACLLQNTGTHTMYVYFGSIANATTSNSFQIQPGQTISCALLNNAVLLDAVNVTGTAGDGYIITNQ